MDEVPRRLDKAGEREEEADDEADVLDRDRGEPRVAVDELALEEVTARVADPSADQGAQGEGDGGEERRRRDVGRDHPEASPQFLLIELQRKLTGIRFQKETSPIMISS